jgi:hypothetical protein
MMKFFLFSLFPSYHRHHHHHIHYCICVYSKKKKLFILAYFFTCARWKQKMRTFFLTFLFVVSTVLEHFNAFLLFSIKGTYYKYLKHYWTHTYAIWLHWIVCLVLRHALMWFLIHFRTSIMYGWRFMASRSEWTWSTRQSVDASMMMMKIVS